ncbi:MAG: hypothetical protein KatS3mg096_752 [Candidatus Parcubacteria bacterium]|nr:MAG: hypothetical protein KatS3mg096_752 [Candidatus Parcubacteria bacterium]
MIEDFFTEELRKIIGDNPEKARELVQRFSNIETIEEWRILKMILQATREKLLLNFKNSGLDQATLIAYKESLTALDFLINLPSELIQIITLNLLTKEESGL